MNRPLAAIQLAATRTAMRAHMARTDVTCPARSDLTTKREAATDRTPRDCRFFLMNTPPSLRNFKKRGAERDQSPPAWNKRPQIFPDPPFPKEEPHSRARRRLYARLVHPCLYLFPLFRTCSQKSSRLKGRRRRIASGALSKPSLLQAENGPQYGRTHSAAVQKTGFARAKTPSPEV